MIEILRTTKQFEIFRENYEELTFGLVPTMGNLHKGHLSLVKESLRNNDISIVSIFVNPKQFGPSEDYEKYPRTLGQDTALLKDLYRQENLVGSNRRLAIFAPETPEEIYPSFSSTIISPKILPDRLCGLHRPDHFDGVATAVFLLFSIIRPHKAYFGQKDFQQYLIIKKMVEDLRLNIQLIPMPIKRDSDGLALSSRNHYLTPEEKKVALTLPQTLSQLKAIIKETPWEVAKNDVFSFVQKTLVDPRWDYLEVLDIKNLEAPVQGTHIVGLFGAFRVGETRLIDNKLVELKYA